MAWSDSFSSGAARLLPRLGVLLIVALAGRPGYSVDLPITADAMDVAFCVDVTAIAKEWDPDGERAAALMADALLGDGARRSLVVFARDARMIAPHGALPMARRPESMSPRDSLRHLMEYPEEGLPDPLPAIELALETLERSPGRRKAIFVLLGHHTRRGATTRQTESLQDLAVRAATRCQLSDTRLFIIHRDSPDMAPGMSELWSDLAGATGGEAIHVDDPVDLATAALEASAAFGGVALTGASPDDILTVGKGEVLALVFDRGADTVQTIKHRVGGSYFQIPPGFDPILHGGLAMVWLQSGDGGEERLPISGHRVLRMFADTARRAEVIIEPKTLTAGRPWSVTVRVDGPFDLPAGSMVWLRRAGASEAEPSVEISPPRGAPGRRVYHAPFSGDAPPGAYRLVIGAGGAQSWRLIAPLRIFDRAPVARIALSGPGETRALNLQAAMERASLTQVKLMAVVRRNDDAPEIVEILPDGDRHTATLSADFQFLDRYRVGVGALVFSDAGLRYVPGGKSEFPRRLKPPTPKAIILPASQTPGNNVAAANVIPTPRSTATPAAPSKSDTPPDEALSSQDTSGATWDWREWSVFVVGNLALVIVLALLWVLGHRVGLFSLRLPKVVGAVGDDSPSIHVMGPNPAPRDETEKQDLEPAEEAPQDDGSIDIPEHEQGDLLRPWSTDAPDPDDRPKTRHLTAETDDDDEDFA